MCERAILTPNCPHSTPSLYPTQRPLDSEIEPRNFPSKVGARSPRKSGVQLAHVCACLFWPESPDFWWADHSER
jgi:hypothetical protein